MQAHELGIIATENDPCFIIEQEKLFLVSENNLPIPIHRIKYDQNQYDDQLYSSLKIKKPVQLDSWVSKRKAQFLSGRTAARKALYSNPHFTNHKVKEENELLIPIGENREAIWPNGFIGSISHSDNVSIATAQPNNVNILGVGLDIQPILSGQEISHVRQTVLTDEDQLLITKEAGELSESQLFTLIFSAKESFFKAAFHSVGNYFDFDIVSADSININSQKITLKCEKTLCETIVQGNKYTLTFKLLEIGAPSVITYCQI